MKYVKLAHFFFFFNNNLGFISQWCIFVAAVNAIWAVTGYKLPQIQIKSLAAASRKIRILNLSFSRQQVEEFILTCFI